MANVKISLFYYSGAGNTKFIAKRIEKSLKNRGYSVKSARITVDLIRDIKHIEADFIGLGFPIYFRNAPELVRVFLQKIEGNGRKIFFFCTKGLYSGNAIREIAKLSIKRGFQPASSIEFYMPGTDALLLLAKKGSFLERFFKSIHSRNIGRKIEQFTQDLFDRTMKVPKKKWYTFLDKMIVERFEIVWSDQNKKLIPQFYSIDDICIKCMKCVKGCPRDNIVFEGRIKFGTNCDTCFYCVHHCPVESIQIGDITKDTVRYRKVIPIEN